MTTHALWWNDQGPYALLHQWMPLRMDFLHRHLPWLTQASRHPWTTVVDVGCGGGLVSFPLAQKGANVWGIDPDPVAIACAQSHQCHAETIFCQTIASSPPNSHTTHTERPTPSPRTAHLNYLCCDPMTWNPPQPVHAIVLFEVLEHTQNPDLLIKHLMGWLTPGGIIIGSTINQTPFSALTSITLAQDILGLVPDHLHTWEAFVAPSTIQAIIRPLTPHLLITQGCLYYPGVGWQYTASCQSHYFFVIQC